MKEKFSLKDHLFNERKVRFLANLLKAADTSFEHTSFVRDAMQTMPDLELKDRIKLIATKLSIYLPKDFSQACRVLIDSLPPPLDPSKIDNDFGDFIFAPFGEFVAQNGATAKNLKISLKTLEEITKRFSMEDAIRTFLNQFPEETLAWCRTLVNHPNYHARRLVSEGTRPFLPWSKRITLTPKDTIPLLDALHSDKTRYVTRSVANHLNDLSKNHPDLVLNTLRLWQKANKQNPAELKWLTAHALRTLARSGNEDALSLLGYDTKHVLSVKSFSLASGENVVRRGDTLMLRMEIVSKKMTVVMIDYIIDFKKARDKSAAKVFKWKKLTLQPNQTHTLEKKHVLRAEATTFKLYAGLHTVTLQINGKKYHSLSFRLA